jgi:PAS domain S-box-containing protein
MNFGADGPLGAVAPPRQLSGRASPGDPSQEIGRLRHCLNNLVSVVALPALWGDAEPLQVMQTSVEALLGLLDLDFVYARSTDPFRGVPLEVLKARSGNEPSPGAQEMRELLDRCLHDDPQKWIEQTRSRVGDQDIGIFSMRLGLHGEIGGILAGSARADFPADEEKLLLRVAANQAALGLQQSAVLVRQRRIASELDERVAQRTAKLAAANEELRKEVAERKRTEEALRDKQQSFRLIVDGIAGLVAIMSANGQLEVVNRQVVDYFGKTVEELKRWAMSDVVHPDDLPGVIFAWEHTIATGAIYDIDHRLRRADGEYRWFHARGLPLRDAHGRIVRWYVLLTDIHERKEAEEKLRRSEADLQEAQRCARLGSWKLDVLSGKVTVSPEIYRRYGVRPEEDTSSADFWFDRIHPDDRARVRGHFEKCLIEKADYEDEYRIITRDGSVKYQHSIGRPVLNYRGDLVEFSGTTIEVTEQVQARIALQKAFDEIEKSERNLSLNINAMPTLLASARPDGWADFFNERWREYTGLSPEQLGGWGWAEPLHPDDAEGLLRIWRSSLLSGAPLEAEARMRRFDGTYRWLLFRANALRDETGAIIKWYGNAVDIEDRKRAEQALQSSECELRSIVNTIPALAWSTTPDGSADFLNQRWLDYTGMSPARAHGWGWMAAVHPADVKQLGDYWRRIMASGESGEIEGRLRRFDGEYRWFLFRASALRDESGNIAGWYGTNTDIDDRKHAEERLRRSEAFLAEGQRVARTGNFSFQIATDEVRFSEQLYHIFGFDAGVPVTVGQIRDRIHPEDQSVFFENLGKARRGECEIENDLRLLLPDGSVRYIHIVAHCSFSEGGQLECVGTVQDITERQRAEEALANARAELAHVTRVTSLGVLAASIAHEVRQPLYGILMNASTCLRMLDADPPDIDGARETARRTIRDGNRASDVITRLRALYGKKEISVESVDLNEAAREVIALSLSELQRNRVVLQQELADDLPRVRGDRVQLQQVILNLLRNASDAMNTINDRPRHLLISTEKDGREQACLAMRDAGVGFDPQVKDRLFEGFYTTKTDGMGIGLSVSRAIIEAHHGRLWAARNDGPGSTFAFSLPPEELLDDDGAPLAAA